MLAKSFDLKCVEPAEPSEVPLRVEEVGEPLQIGPDDDVVARICLESGSLDEGRDFDSKVRILEFTDASEQAERLCSMMVFRRDRRQSPQQTRLPR